MSTESDTESETENETSTNTESPPTCGYEKEDGEPCQIPVESEDQSCHIEGHQPLDDDDVEDAAEESETSENTGGSEESGNSKKTVLYCFPREALREEDLAEIAETLEDAGYTLSTSEGEGDNLLIQREAVSGNSLNLSEALGN